jgi:hypothetical protein
MLKQILRHFPPHVHPLTLVHDPDNVLADETVLAHLTERGFTILAETDPVQLQQEVAQFGRWSRQRPLILVTPKPLNELPYDLWQQGQHVVLALHTFFPTLSYPVVQALTINQRWQLAQCPLPGQTAGRQGSIDFVLRHLFQVDWEKLATASGLIGWLNRYHLGEPMPTVLAPKWLSELQPQYPQWPLQTWLENRETFQAAISQEWQQYVVTKVEGHLGETGLVYHLGFAADERLQDILPQLVRSGAVQPVMLADAAPLPTWAQAGVRASAADFAQQRMDSLLALLSEQARNLANFRWEQWQAIALTWAELTAWRHHPQRYVTEAQRDAYAQWQAGLDTAFAVWLQRGYASVAGQKLPRPHHLFHVLHWIAYQRRRQTAAQRIALLVLDGMSLAAWSVIARTWRQRHPEWQLAEHLVLAQIPSLTAVSRQALVAGERPANFADSIADNRQEKQLWTKFWARENVAAAACAYSHLALRSEQSLPAALTSNLTQALCLINNSIDKMIHGATQGLTDVHASLDNWLHGTEGARLEEALVTLISSGYTVYLTSDHGHTEAWGMGQPTEGVTVHTRSKRARIYTNQQAALVVQEHYPQTTLWPSQRLLPAEMWVLLAGMGENGRRLAFTQQGERVVTHGGITLDELVVPLVQIT